MTELNQMYECGICGNIVEILHEGADALVCCGQDMELIKENIANSTNPHFAVIEKQDAITKKITINHTMTEEHYIEFIEVISKDNKYLKRKYFSYNEPCEMTVKCDCKNGFDIRVYCNKDGIWITK